MSKLGATYIYCLNFLISGPQFPAQNPYIRRLQQRGLILSTGCTDPRMNQVEYEITEASRDEIAARTAVSHERNPQ